MRLSSKVILWSWAVLLVVLLAMMYSAYSRLNPDALVSMMDEQVRKNYPGARLKVGKIDYGVSLDFTLKLSQLVVERNDRNIATAEEVQFKIPWWLILFKSGNAQININHLDIFVTTSDLPVERTDSLTSAGKLKALQITLPAYMVDANYTVRAKEISIKEVGGGRDYFTLSRLLVREFQFGKNSAFEVNVPIQISHRNKKYHSDLWLFGDVTPKGSAWIVNYRGEFKTKDMSEVFQFDDLVIDGKSVFNPSAIDLESELNLSIERQKVGAGFFQAKNQLLTLKLNFTTFPMDYLSLLGDEIKNPFLRDLGKVGQGEITFSKPLTQADTIGLKAKLNFSAPFFLAEKSTMDGKWQLNFENDKLESSFISARGEVTFFRRSVLDYDNQQVSQYSQELGFNGLAAAEVFGTLENLGDYVMPVNQTYHSSVVSIKKATLEDGSTIDGSFRYGVSPYQKFYTGELFQGPNSFNVNYLGKAPTNQLSLEFKKFPMQVSFQFLQPYLATVGVLDGKIEGNWSEHWSSGLWNIKMKASGISTLTGDFADFNHQLFNFFSIDPTSVASRSWSGNASKGTVKLSSLILDGVDPANLSGVLSTLPKTKSFLTLTYPKNRKWKPVKKEVTEVFWKKDSL